MVGYALDPRGQSCRCLLGGDGDGPVVLSASRAVVRSSRNVFDAALLLAACPFSLPPGRTRLAYFIYYRGVLGPAVHGIAARGWRTRGSKTLRGRRPSLNETLFVSFLRPQIGRDYPLNLSI